jgi:hypothetical protein
VVSVSGEPIGRFARILAEARDKGLAVEPYEVTEELIIYPPTETRLKALDQASAAHLLAQAAAVDLVRSQGVPPDTADHEARVQWASQRNAELQAAYEQAEKALDAYNIAFFGGEDVYQRVNEFFAGRDYMERRLFEKDIKEQFLKLPVDDKCQACGQVVDPTPGEPVGESSGGSSTSGTSSTETSPESSTEPTSSTGSEEPDPGPSSSTELSSVPE